MAKWHTSRLLVSIAIGGVAGVAFVPADDLFTQVVGCLSGCACMSIAYVVLEIFVGRVRRTSFPSSRWRAPTGHDDYDERAYRIERNFMDDGKPW